MPTYLSLSEAAEGQRAEGAPLPQTQHGTRVTGLALTTATTQHRGFRLPCISGGLAASHAGCKARCEHGEGRSSLPAKQLQFDARVAHDTATGPYMKKALHDHCRHKQARSFRRGIAQDQAGIGTEASLRATLSRALADVADASQRRVVEGSAAWHYFACEPGATWSSICVEFGVQKAY
ncbi:unnamed protein product [Symbiodinium sp. CCMP2592]|nr:unnamed protein product [Symbiodinium sp. CCMP2592]